MKKAMFDTSVYGELVDDEAALGRIADCINVSFLVFGSSTIREELEATPAITLVSRGRFKGLSLRRLLLWLYELFAYKSGGEVKGTDLVEVLALRYQLMHLKNSKSGMLNDFRIVAAASLQGMELFVSVDKAQLSERCKSIYLAVNSHYQLNSPLFVAYTEFKEKPESYSTPESHTDVRKT